MRIEGYAHHQGRRPGPTALWNLSLLYGWGLDEPACLGLGAGVGFSYRETAGPPGRALTGRTPFLERALLDRLGVGFERRQGGDWADVRRGLAEHLEAGRPVVLFADRGRLPYHPAEVGVTPHPVVVVGHQDGAVHLSDGDRADLETVADGRLREATASGALPGRHRRLVVTDPDTDADPSGAAAAAVEATASFMLQPAGAPYDPGEGAHGLGGIQHLVASAAEWPSLAEPRLAARAAAREVRGREGDGAAYRGLWRAFLEAAEHPHDAVTEGMDAVVEGWRTVGASLAAAAEAGSDYERHIDDAAAALGELADREARLYTSV
jgi:hypothetical protein